MIVFIFFFPILSTSSFIVLVFSECISPIAS